MHLTRVGNSNTRRVSLFWHTLYTVFESLTCTSNCDHSAALTTEYVQLLSDIVGGRSQQTHQTLQDGSPDLVSHQQLYQLQRCRIQLITLFHAFNVLFRQRYPRRRTFTHFYTYKIYYDLLYFYASAPVGSTEALCFRVVRPCVCASVCASC